MCMEESFAMLILSSEIEALLTITGWECMEESLAMLILSSKIVHNQRKHNSIGYCELINY